MYSWTLHLSTVKKIKEDKKINDADLNDAVTKSCLRSEIDGYIIKLCKDLIHLLGLCAIIERTSLVEKCCILYDIILNIKFTGNCLRIHLA